MTPDELADLLAILAENDEIAWEDIEKIVTRLFEKTRFTK